MIVYHGSTMAVPKPDIVHSRKRVDFGKGFYVTPIYSQARSWSEKNIRLNQPGVISKYTFLESALKEMKTLYFDSYSEEWLDFIMNCRQERDKTDYDIVIGGVANDRVFNTVELYFNKLIDKKETINRLKYNKPNLQICFRTQATIDRYLQYEGCEQL